MAKEPVNLDKGSKSDKDLISSLNDKFKELTGSFKDMFDKLNGKIDEWIKAFKDVPKKEPDKGPDKYDSKSQDDSPDYTDVLKGIEDAAGQANDLLEQINSSIAGLKTDKGKESTGESSKTEAIAKAIPVAEQATQALGIGGTIKPGDMAVVGDDPSGKPTGHEEVIFAKPEGGVDVLSNVDSKAEGYLGIPKFAAGTDQFAGQGNPGDVAKNIMSTIGDVVHNTVGLIPEVGPVIDGLMLGFEKLGNVTVDLVESFNKLTDKLAKYSGVLTSAQVESQIKEMETDIKIGDELGDDLASLYQDSNEIWQDIREMMIPLQKGVLDLIVPLMSGIKDVVIDLKEPVAGSMIAIIGWLKIIYYASRFDYEGASKARQDMLDAMQRLRDGEDTSAYADYHTQFLNAQANAMTAGGQFRTTPSSGMRIL